MGIHDGNFGRSVFPHNYRPYISQAFYTLPPSHKTLLPNWTYRTHWKGARKQLNRYWTFSFDGYWRSPPQQVLFDARLTGRFQTLARLGNINLGFDIGPSDGNLDQPFKHTPKISWNQSSHEKYPYPIPWNTACLLGIPKWVENRASINPLVHHFPNQKRSFSENGNQDGLMVPSFIKWTSGTQFPDPK